LTDSSLLTDSCLALGNRFDYALDAAGELELYIAVPLPVNTCFTFSAGSTFDALYAFLSFISFRLLFLTL
jgi:hypothetical protein